MIIYLLLDVIEEYCGRLRFEFVFFSVCAKYLAMRHRFKRGFLMKYFTFLINYLLNGIVGLGASVP